MYQQVVANLPHEEIDQVINELMQAYEHGKNIFMFGNGGSASLASHFACDLNKGTVISENGQKRFRVLALTDNIPLMTAWANDSCYDQIFAEQLRNFVASGDVALAISGSGNSPNVLRGLEVARSHGARTIGLTGFEGGKMKSLCNICVVLHSDNMQVIEDFHLSMTHAIFSVIRLRVSERLDVQRLATTGTAD
ncbi:MAG: SIS domain-containing protein [Candidatus Sulfotelmatobacter sp.]|jgi:D-sedoheptulose 7-phosphate isomerase